MNEEKLKYVNYIKEKFFSEPFLSEICKAEVMKPKYRDLSFSFISGKNKLMIVLDEETNIKLEF